MPAVMKSLNLKARALATTVMLALLVGLLAGFTLGYTPNQGKEITITSGGPAASRGQLSQPW